MSHWRRRLHGRSRYRSLRWNYRLFKTRCDLYRWGNLRRNDRHGLVRLAWYGNEPARNGKSYADESEWWRATNALCPFARTFRNARRLFIRSDNQKNHSRAGLWARWLESPFSKFFRGTKNAYQLSQSLGTSSFVSHFGRTDQSLGHWHVGMARDLSTFLRRCYSHRFSWSIFPG